MKKAILLLTLLAGSWQLWSAPVTQHRARKVAADFMARRGISHIDVQPLKVPRRTAGSSTAEVPSYYVFNAADARGFVLISADDRTEPVLGYSDSGMFDEEHMSDGLTWLLQSYEEQIARLDVRQPVAATSGVSQMYSPAVSNAQWRAPGEQTRRSIRPLLASLWNQGDPYNLLCPRYYNQDGTQGGLSATGCVATAIAQVMGYYRFPNELQRTIPGYMQEYDTDQGKKSVRLNSIPVGSVIDWAHIVPYYDSQSSEAQKTAIAQLMYWVGMSCRMGYGSQSAAGFSEGVKGLINYFGYDDGSHIESRGSYTAAGWSDLLYNELLTGHPIAFAGTNSGGAHAFVLDGYDVDGLFHVNWGWGGMNNGYFRIDVLAPDDNSGIGASLTPDGYNMGQEAIILRLPDDEKAATVQPRLNINDWELRNGGRTFFANFVNWSGVSTTWDAAIAEVLSDGTLQLIGSSRQFQLSPNYFIGAEFAITGLEEGIHRVVPVSKRSVTSEWLTHVPTSINYIEVEVNANRQVVSARIHPIEDVEVSSISYPGTLKMGERQTVEVTFVNNGDEYHREVHLLASPTNDRGEGLCRTAVLIQKGGEGRGSFFFTPTQEGMWHIWLANDREGRQVLAEDSVEITSQGMQRQQNLRFVSLTVNNSSNGYVMGNRIQGKLTVLNQSTTAPFDGNLRLWLFKLNPSDGYFYGANSVYVNMHVEPRKTASTQYYFDHLDDGGQYVMSILYAEGGDIQDGGLRQVGTVQPGVVYWQQNKTMSGLNLSSTISTPSGAVAIDLTGLGGRYNDVRPNANPNTLYFIDADMDVPESLKGRNVVRGMQCDSLVLTDGYGFFSPSVFYAQKAVYSRQLAADARQWETIVLPFGLEDLPQDAEVKYFDCQDEAGNVHFESVGQMQANVPYVIRSKVAEADSMTFQADHAVVESALEMPMQVGTSDYLFVGTTVSTAITAGYVVNADGTAFEPIGSRTQIKPFHAYFIGLLPADQQAGQLPVCTPDELGIKTIECTEAIAAGLYDLSGRRVKTPQRTGLYISNGRKVIIR